MVGKNVTYSHNVVVSFTAQNQQALLQATQQADRALQGYNRTILSNVTQLSNVTRAQQSYTSSLTQVSTQTTAMGKSVTNMGSTFSATVAPIRNSGNALNQFTATTNTSSQSFSKWGGFVKNNLANIGLLSVGIAGLDDQFNSMNKAQVGLERANLQLAKANNRVEDTQNKLNKMVKEGKQGTAEYIALDKDLTIAKDALSVATDRQSVAQTNLSEATESFWTGIIPNAMAIGGSLGMMLQGLGLKTDILKSKFASLAQTIKGMSGAQLAFAGLGTAAGAAAVGIGALLIPNVLELQAIIKALGDPNADIDALSARIDHFYEKITNTDPISKFLFELSTMKQLALNVSGDLARRKIPPLLETLLGDVTFQGKVPAQVQSGLQEQLDHIVAIIENPNNWKNPDFTATSTKTLLGLVTQLEGDIKEATIRFVLSDANINFVVNKQLILDRLKSEMLGTLQGGEGGTPTGLMAMDAAIKVNLKPQIALVDDLMKQLDAKLMSLKGTLLEGDIDTSWLSDYTEQLQGQVDTWTDYNSVALQTNETLLKQAKSLGATTYDLGQYTAMFGDSATKIATMNRELQIFNISQAKVKNFLDLNFRAQETWNAGIYDGTVKAGEFLKSLNFNRASAEAFRSELMNLNPELSNLQNQYHLTNEETMKFAQLQNEGGDALEFLADAIKDEAGPALEYFNDLLTTETKKEFREKWKDKKKEFERMGIDDETIDLMEKNAKRKRDVSQDIADMSEALQGIALIGFPPDETAIKSINKLTDEIIESYDEIEASDEDLKAVNGFPEYVKRVIASGDPTELAKLQKVIDLINQFWEEDEEIDPHEASLINDAINGLGTASGDAAPKIGELTEEQQKIVDNKKIKASIDAQTGAIELQTTYVNKLNLALALRNSLLSGGGGGDGNVPTVTDVFGNSYGSDIYGNDMCVDEYGRRVNCRTGKPTKKQPKPPSAIERGFDEERYMQNPEQFAVSPFGYTRTGFGDTKQWDQMALDAGEVSSQIQTVFSSMFTAVNGIFDGIAQHWSDPVATGMIATAQSVSKVGISHFNTMVENSAGLMNMLASHWSVRGADMIATDKNISVQSNKIFKQLVENAAGNFNDLANHWSNQGANMIETAKSVAKGINKELDNIEDEEVRINIVTTKTTKYEVKNIQHGGAFIRNAQHGMAGIIGRPISMDGMLMGEHSKPELVTVTPLTNPNNIADTSIKLSATGGNDSGSRHLLQRILAAIESIRLDASFKLEGNDIVRSKDIFASISPLLGKQQAKYG